MPSFLFNIVIAFALICIKKLIKCSKHNWTRENIKTRDQRGPDNAVLVLSHFKAVM